MIHKLSEIRQRIAAQRLGRGKDARYKASCPMCSWDYSVDVLSSDRSAEVSAIQRVVRHITETHADEIDQNA